MLNAPMSGREAALEEVMDALRPGQVVCAGPRVTPGLEALAERCRAPDYTTTSPGKSWRWPMRCPPRLRWDTGLGTAAGAGMESAGPLIYSYGGKSARQSR